MSSSLDPGRCTRQAISWSFAGWGCCPARGCRQRLELAAEPAPVKVAVLPAVVPSGRDAPYGRAGRSATGKQLAHTSPKHMTSFQGIDDPSQNLSEARRVAKTPVVRAGRAGVPRSDRAGAGRGARVPGGRLIATSPLPAGSGAAPVRAPRSCSCRGGGGCRRAARVGDCRPLSQPQPRQHSAPAHWCAALPETGHDRLQTARHVRREAVHEQS